MDVFLGRKTAREKISCLLALVARRKASLPLQSAGDTVTVDLPMSRSAMGDYMVLTIKTVSRQVMALRKARIIEVTNKRQITIPGMRRLMAETSDDTEMLAWRDALFLSSTTAVSDRALGWK